MMFSFALNKNGTMKITGKLINILESQSGKSSNGAWKKQDFIIETLDAYPKKICISNWNDKIDLKKVEVGTIIDVYIQIESRTYNDRWYTNIKAWKIESEVKKNFENISENKTEGSDQITNDSPEGDLPF